MIEDFFIKWGVKICAIKKVADVFLADNATLIQNHKNSDILRYQDELKIPIENRFTKDDLKEIYLEFQTIIRNYSRVVLAITKDDDITSYYIFDGFQLKWVNASEYINLFNMENETICMLDPYRFE